VIHNATTQRWTFSEIQRSCGCTIVAPSGPFVEPHQTTNLSFKYRAGNESVDDRRSIIVLFAEPQAPRLLLKVDAKIRWPMEFSQHEVVFRMGQGRTSERQIEIDNFSDGDWRAIAVSSSAGWLVASGCNLLPRLAAAPASRQKWQALLRVNTASLAIGHHYAELEFDAAPAGPKNSLHVDLLVRTPVTAIPSSLFFGRLRVGESIHRTVLLCIEDQSVKLHPSDIRVTYPNGQGLRVIIEPSAHATKFVKMDAFFEASSSRETHQKDRILDGKIVVNLHAEGIPDITIPYHTMILNK
jgi:hypothetical protein